MFRNYSINNSSQPRLNIASSLDFIIELDEQKQELIVGGSFAGQDKIRVRLTSLDATQNQHPAINGIRSIPTLMQG